MKINLTFSETFTAFNTEFSSSDEFKLGFEAGMAPANCVPYEGSYEVTPAIEAQTLPTADRHMKEDLRVLEIPYFEVGNTQNGKTIIIGGM